MKKISVIGHLKSNGEVIRIIDNKDLPPELDSVQIKEAFVNAVSRGDFWYFGNPDNFYLINTSAYADLHLWIS
jgi:hypothetical protein